MKPKNSTLLKIFDFLLYSPTSNEDNLLAFYLVFVEIKSRFQFYGKSERKHVKYFLKMHTLQKRNSFEEKKLMEHKSFYHCKESLIKVILKDQFGNSED